MLSVLSFSSGSPPIKKKKTLYKKALLNNRSIRSQRYTLYYYLNALLRHKRILTIWGLTFPESVWGYQTHTTISHVYGSLWPFSLESNRLGSKPWFCPLLFMLSQVALNLLGSSPSHLKIQIPNVLRKLQEILQVMW